MWPGFQAIDLHHTDPSAKLTGLPGDELTHAKCNRGERQRRQRAERKAKAQAQVMAGCRHGGGAVTRQRPVKPANANSSWRVHECPGCGGFQVTDGRVWPCPGCTEGCGWCPNDWPPGIAYRARQATRA
jgi:hypothetical protein